MLTTQFLLKRKLTVSFALIMILSGIFSCAQIKGTPADLIKKYEHLVLEMKADSISQLFTPDAEIGHEGSPAIKGRDSIYAFLSSFKNVKVVRNVDSISTISLQNDRAVVNGIYRQTVIVSGKDTINVRGQFTSNMIRGKNRNWFISSMKTRSL